CPQSCVLAAAHCRAMADRKLVGCKCACPLPPAPTSDANSSRHATATFSRTHLTSEVWPLGDVRLGSWPCKNTIPRRSVRSHFGSVFHIAFSPADVLRVL